MHGLRENLCTTTPPPPFGLIPLHSFSLDPLVNSHPVPLPLGLGLLGFPFLPSCSVIRLVVLDYSLFPGFQEEIVPLYTQLTRGAPLVQLVPVTWTPGL